MSLFSSFFSSFSSLILLGIVVGCGNSSVASPFVSTDASSDAHGQVDAADGGVTTDGEAAPAEAGRQGEWGGPCVDDQSCDDGTSCTSDECDSTLHRCHFTADDARCDDGVYCNGVEECVPRVGCRSGEPVACSDDTACTIDACEESTHQCTHVPRDADGDGDPDGNCPGGGDCNDQNPDISSKAVEICANGIDDDCDGVTDESDCTAPKYDTCAAPLDVTASGSFLLTTAAAKLDYAASCVKQDARNRDLAVAVHIPPGGSTDVELTVDGTGGTEVSLAAAQQCGDASSEIECGVGATAPDGTPVARIRLRGLPEGVYPVYLFTTSAAVITLAVSYVPAEPEPPNETCGTATPITSGTHVDVNLIDAAPDLETACGAFFGELVYDFDLTEPHDVRAFATAQDPNGTPILSLRKSPCSDKDTELLCHEDQNDTVFYRALPAGHYYLAVGATGPTDLDVMMTVSDVTAAGADETCAGSPELELGKTQTVDLSDNMDDIQLGCAVGMPDAAYALNVPLKSDVLLLLGASNGDTAAVSLATPPCDTNSMLACGTGSGPVRAVRRGVSPGDYRVVVESTRSNPVSIAAFTKPAAAPFLVPFSDHCDEAADIPETGGSFQGNTANSTDDVTASCDLGGGSPSPDQILHLHLTKPRRVILDTKGSDYATIVDVRTGSSCPGDEVLGGCSAGYSRDRSFVDLTLAAGDYWVQIDGYDESSGPWVLDVFTTD